VNTTLEFFDFQAELYDGYQRTCIPQYEEMLRVAAAVLASSLSDASAPRILDVGCGTGNATAELAKHLPGAVFTCLDGSEAMLSAAREKLSGLTNDFRRADLQLDGWAEPWNEETFDGAISVLVLEHLPFEAYRRFLRRLLNLLRPGARIITVEGYAGDLNQTLFFAEMAQWEKRAESSGAVPSDQLEKMKRLSAESEHHFLATMEEKKIWWIEAGYEEVEFVWQYYCVATLTGRKPTGKDLAFTDK
jgi:tRNA (cmo5U34)-methyltransferase